MKDMEKGNRTLSKTDNVKGYRNTRLRMWKVGQSECRTQRKRTGQGNKDITVEFDTRNVKIRYNEHKTWREEEGYKKQRDTVMISVRYAKEDAMDAGHVLQDGGHGDSKDAGETS